MQEEGTIDYNSCTQMNSFSFQWEDQHEGISCDQFAQWKTANDPEAQKAGLAAILKENGIGKILLHVYINY